MAVNNLLSNLKKVKSTGKNRWVSCCPAHSDKSPSLSVRLLDDERILIHCFAGCPVESILQAVGLSISDLMPENIHFQKKSETRPFTAADALRCVANEALLTAATACRLASGEPIDGHDKDRLLLASNRIRAALQGAGL